MTTATTATTAMTATTATAADPGPDVVAGVCRVCAVGCGVRIERHAGRIVKVAGDPDDPWSRGYTCALGRSAPDLHHRPDRFDVPLVRRRGRLEPTTWEEALDGIVASVRAIVERHGPDAVAHYTGTGGPLDPTGYAMAHGFFRALGTSQAYSALSIDCPGKFLVPELVAGVQLGFHPDLDHCRLLLAIGVNTVVSHGHGVMVPNPVEVLRGVRRRGARVVVVDPRRSESAHHADVHLAVRPGTDPALLAFLVRHVLSRGPDASFAELADAAGRERLAAFVAPFDADRAAAVCGVAAGDLEHLAGLVAAAGRIAVETGTGVSMGRAGNVTEWLAWALAAVTGSLDRRGGVLFNPGFLRPLEGGVPGGRGDRRPGPASRPEVRRLVNGEIPCAALADEIGAGHVRALFVRGGNPVTAFPDTARTRAALSELELLVVADAVPTATTELATHVLPVADHFERGDLVSGYLQAEPFLRWAPAVVAPAGERRPPWWLYGELSRRLGLPRLGSGRAEQVLAEAEAAGALDDEAVAAVVARSARRRWDDVRRAPYGVRQPADPGWMIPALLPRLLDVAPAELVGAGERWTRQLPGADELLLVNRRTGRRYNSLSPRPGADVRRAPLLVHPADAVRLALLDGGRARLSSAHGACDVEVELSATMRPGVVSLPHGSAVVELNALTSADDIDPLTGMPVFSGIPVAVAPL